MILMFKSKKEKEENGLKEEKLVGLFRILLRSLAPMHVLGGGKVKSLKAMLALTLKFLATGETYRSLCFQFRISRAAISYIINDVCKAIAMHLEKCISKYHPQLRNGLLFPSSLKRNGNILIVWEQLMANIL